MGFGLFRPKHQVIGADFAGRVESVGEKVTTFKTGDEVFGSGIGAFAEYTTIRESRVVHKPSGITFEQAASLPVAGVTALQGLRDHGRVEAGQQVVINGASGGVGSFAVQIAKVMGAHVTGVCSGRNVELVRSIGADHVIDYTREKYWQSDTKYDLIVDTAAFYPISKPLSALKPSGTYVPVGGDSSGLGVLKAFVTNPIIAKIKKRRLASFITAETPADLRFMGELVESGKVTPVIGRTYTLSETAEAVRDVETGHTRGKVVITV